MRQNKNIIFKKMKINFLWKVHNKNNNKSSTDLNILSLYLYLLSGFLIC